MSWTQSLLLFWATAQRNWMHLKENIKYIQYMSKQTSAIDFTIFPLINRRERQDILPTQRLRINYGFLDCWFTDGCGITKFHTLSVFSAMLTLCATSYLMSGAQWKYSLSWSSLYLKLNGLSLADLFGNLDYSSIQSDNHGSWIKVRNFK